MSNPKPTEVLAAAEDWSNVSVIDTNCSSKFKADPDSHTRACALKCAKSGFGILDKDGNYLKFDAKGNQEAITLLQNSTKKDHPPSVRLRCIAYALLIHRRIFAGRCQ
jgi:hypothetical protein